MEVELELVERIPALQWMIGKLVEKECERGDIAIPPGVVITRQEHPIVIVSGDNPTLLIDAAWVVNLTANRQTGILVYALRRSLAAAVAYCSRSLANASPPEALKMNKDNFRFYKVVGDQYKLPQRHFAVTCSITVTDPQTGLTVTGSGEYKDRDSLYVSLSQQLTTRIVQQDETSWLTEQATEAVKVEQVIVNPLGESGVALTINYSAGTSVAA